MSYIHSTLLLIAGLSVLLGLADASQEVGWTLLAFSGVTAAGTVSMNKWREKKQVPNKK